MAQPEPTNTHYVPPMVISRPLPRWPAAMGARELNGVIELRVSAAGDVESVTIQQAFHPLYDTELARVAHSWKFQPATVNGVPAEATKVFNLTIRPPD